LPALAAYKRFPGLEGATYYYFDILKNPINGSLVPEHQKRFNAPTAGGFEAGMATALVLNIWRWSRCCSGARAGCTRLAGEARAGAADTARPHCSGSGAGAAPFPLFRGDQRRRQDLHDDTACRVLWPAVCYTGIVSFADVMFFGFGAYGVSHMLYAPAASWGPVLLGLVAAAGLSLAIGLLSLRVQSIFLAMMMLADRLRLQCARFAALVADQT
jgi:hypothetical protein